MRKLAAVAVLVAAAALAAVAVAQPTTTVKKISPAQRAQLQDLLKGPGLRLVGELDLPVTFQCEQEFRTAIAEFRRAVETCASLDSPAPGSPIANYNAASASQQFATCQAFPDEFTCFRDKLIPDQQRFCEQKNDAQKRRAERARAICVAKECAKLNVKIKTNESEIRAAEQQIAELRAKIEKARRDIAEAQRDRQQARCNN